MLLDDIKVALRIRNTNFAFDEGEIEPLIDAARHELMLSGISAEKVKAEIPVSALESDMDPLIKRAITVYVKANFGFDNPDADKLKDSFEMLRNHLSLAGDYNAIP
jgi:hypothetical protein